MEDAGPRRLPKTLGVDVLQLPVSRAYSSTNSIGGDEGHGTVGYKIAINNRPVNSSLPVINLDANHPRASFEAAGERRFFVVAEVQAASTMSLRWHSYSFRRVSVVRRR